MAHYAGMYGAMAPHSFGQPSLYYQGASAIEQPYATSFPYAAWQCFRVLRWPQDPYGQQSGMMAAMSPAQPIPCQSMSPTQFGTNPVTGCTPQSGVQSPINQGAAWQHVYIYIKLVQLECVRVHS